MAQKGRGINLINKKPFQVLSPASPAEDSPMAGDGGNFSSSPWTADDDRTTWTNVLAPTMAAFLITIQI